MNDWPAIAMNVGDFISILVPHSVAGSSTLSPAALDHDALCVSRSLSCPYGKRGYLVLGTRPHDNMHSVSVQCPACHFLL